VERKERASNTIPAAKGDIGAGTGMHRRGAKGDIGAGVQCGRTHVRGWGFPVRTTVSRPWSRRGRYATGTWGLETRSAEDWRIFARSGYAGGRRILFWIGSNPRKKNGACADHP
jgi:hypothetical protein